MLSLQSKRFWNFIFFFCRWTWNPTLLQGISETCNSSVGRKFKFLICPLSFKTFAKVMRHNTPPIRLAISLIMESPDDCRIFYVAPTPFLVFMLLLLFFLSKSLMVCQGTESSWQCIGNWQKMVQFFFSFQVWRGFRIWMLMVEQSLVIIIMTFSTWYYH